MPDDYFQAPIPVLRTHQQPFDHYHAIPVDATADQNKEVLVSVSDYGVAGESYYARTDGLNAPYYRSFEGASRRPVCRSTVAAKLALVNDRLAPYGVELFVWDGYRPIECQRALWQHFLAEARRQLDRPSETESINFAARYCSDPSRFSLLDSTSWPTHVTGGAIDLTLRRRDNGELLYMGGIFDDASEASHTAFYEEPSFSVENGSDLSASAYDARRNRRLLYWALTSEGFQNLDYEWWHYDWGNQLWFASLSPELRDGKAAWYGPLVQVAT